MATYPTPISLFNIFSDVRHQLVTGFRSFPTAFAGATLFIGLFTGNYAMLFFLVGLLVVTPFVNFVLGLLGTFSFFSWLGTLLPDSLKTPNQSAICNLVLKDGQLGEGATAPMQFITDWTAMAAFIFAYLFSNAYALYGLPVEYPANATADDQAAYDEKAGLRKSRAVISMLMILVIALVFFTIRLFVSKCEGYIGMGFGLILYSLLGVGWFYALNSSGQGRLSDLFGVANRLLAPTALTNQPYVCLPQASTSTSTSS
jgi:hypothetical protein